MPVDSPAGVLSAHARFATPGERPGRPAFTSGRVPPRNCLFGSPRREVEGSDTLEDPHEVSKVVPDDHLPVFSL